MVFAGESTTRRGWPIPKHSCFTRSLYPNNARRIA